MGGLIELSSKDLFCGATIISGKYGLTAAHCLTGKHAQEIGFLVGDHNINTGEDTAAAALYVLEKFDIHPNYDVNTATNDIAIIKTQKHIKFSYDVGPVCLPFRYSSLSFTGETVTVLGWGTTEFSGMKSEKLLEVNLTIISNEECRGRATAKPITDGQICTYTPEKDACQSDSGGPLLWWAPDTHRYHVIGGVSYGLGCATEIPAVNTRVSSYLAWIVSTTSGKNFLSKINEYSVNVTFFNFRC